MKRSTPLITRVLISTAAVLFVIAVASGTFAQGKEGSMAPQWMDVTRIDVRPDKVSEFRSFIKNEYNPAVTKGGLTTNFVWQTAGFGDAFRYYFVRPVDKMADMDGPSPIEKGLSKEGVAAFFDKAGTLVTDVRTYAMAERPDLTYMSKKPGMPKMAVLMYFRIGQGHEADFESFMINEFLPSWKKADAASLLAHQTVFGGSQNEYYMLAPIDNYAELDKGHPIARVEGRDGFKRIMQKLQAGTVVDSEVTVIRLNESLSIIPAPAK